VAVVHKAGGPRVVYQNLSRHAPKLEYVDLLSVEPQNRVSRVGQPDEGQSLASEVRPEADRALRANHDDLG